MHRTRLVRREDFTSAQSWPGRDYEPHAEVIAIRRLLERRRFRHAVDVGGGHGRLSVILAEFSGRVTMADPGSQRRRSPGQVLGPHPVTQRRLTEAARLQFPDHSVDLVTFIGVPQHVPDSARVLPEISRILRPGGVAVIEAINVEGQLAEVDLRLLRVLSVSSLKHPAVTTVVPGRVMPAGERAPHRPLVTAYFRPRTFFLLEKKPGDGRRPAALPQL